MVPRNSIYLLYTVVYCDDEVCPIYSNNKLNYVLLRRNACWVSKGTLHSGLREKKQFAREQLGIASRRGCLIRCRQKKGSSIGAQNQQNNESTFVYTDGGDEEDVSRLACSSEIYYCSAWSQKIRPKVVPLWIKKVERGKSCFSWVIDCSHHEQRAQRMHPIRALRPPLQRCPP